jgi:hypothetical protein
MSKDDSVYFDPLTSGRINKLENVDEYDRVLSYKLSSSATSLENNTSKERPVIVVNKMKDRTFILAYSISLGIFLVTGLGALEWTLPTKMYNKFVNTLVPELKAIMTVSMIVGLVWSWALSYFTRAVVYSMLLVVPSFLFVTSIVVLVNSGTFIVPLCLLLFSLILFGLFKLNKEGIDSTITIVKSAATVLRENLQIYFYSLSTTMIFIILVLGWLVLAAGIFNTSSMALQLNALLVMIWTGSIIGNYQRGLIANCVVNWYYYKRTAFKPTKYIGQFCFAGLILSVVDLMRFLNWSVKKTIEQFKNGVIKSISSYCLSLATAFEAALAHFTQFSVLQVVISEGETSFYEASQHVYALFRRNILLTAINDMTASLIFAVTGACTALGSGLVWHTINMENDEAQSFMVPAIVALVTFMVLRFFTGIYSAAIDASFLCYSMDIDEGKEKQATNNGLAENSQERLALFQAFGLRTSQLPK